MRTRPFSASPQVRPLAGTVAVVAGATRGAGRGIAVALGELGATVYCVGRSTRAEARPPVERASPFTLAHRPETIEETAELVDAAGGVGRAHVADLTVEDEVQVLFERVLAERGRLDVLVNDVWGGDELAEWGRPFWELSLHKGTEMIHRAVLAHVALARYGAPLLIAGGRGLVVEVTDGTGDEYRGNLFYDLAKASALRLAKGMAEELRPHGVAALAVTPGFLRSEAMLEHMGVTEATWEEGAERDPHFIASETPLYVGRAVAALAADPDVMEKTGGAYASWDLARLYGFTDADGSQPDWGEHYAAHVAAAEVA